MLKYCGNTTNLISHLKTQHSQIYLKAGFITKSSGAKNTSMENLGTSSGQKITDAFKSITKFPTSSRKSMELTDAIAYFIGKDMHPVSIVQGAGFKHMVQHLEPRYQVPYRKTFADRVLPNLYMKVKDSMSSVITTADHFALTTDCWTSRANEAYIGVTFHTITNEWELQHFTLQNKELPDQHTAETLAKALQNALEQWKLDPLKLSCVTIDNAANIQKAVSQTLSWQSMGCFGHTINLCVKAGLKQPQVSTAVARCSRIIAFFHRSPRASHVLSEKQEALGCNSHKLIQDVDTRWNSTFEMVERIIEQQASICAALADQKRLDLLPKDAEFQILEELVTVLKPFKEVTHQVSAQVYVTISAIWPILHHLRVQALRVVSSDSLAIQAMKKEMKQNLDGRYKSESIIEMLDKACFVDPRFKRMPFLSDSETTTLHNNIVEEMVKYTPSDIDDDDEAVCIGSEGTDQPPAKKPKTLLGQLLGDMFSKPNENRPLSRRQKAEEELKRYLDEPSPDIDDCPLKWWKQHHSRFTAISKVAKQTLCIPATSTPSERLFSKAGQIINKKRGCLDPQNVDLLCFLAENLP